MEKGEKAGIDSAYTSANLRMDYKALLENTGISIVITDISGQYIFANSTAASFLGCDVQDVIGKPMSDFLPPEIVQKYLVRNRQLINSGKGEVYEATFDLPTGTKTFLINDQVLKDDQGNGFAIQSSSIDITERKEPERILAEKEQEYRLLVQNLPGTTVLLFDYDLRFILAEGYLHPEFGFTTNQMEGKTLWDVLPKERAEIMASLYRNALQGKSTENFVSAFKDHYFSTNIIPVRNNKGELMGGMMVSQDITESKRVERELEGNYSLLRIAGETAKFGGWALNLADNKVIWTDEVAAIHEMPAGYSPSLEEGINFYVPEYQNVIANAADNCANNGIPFDEELELITARGNRVWVRVTGEAIRNENGKIFKIQGSFQDISERKRTERLIREGEEKWHLLVETIPDYIALYDADGKYLFLNHFAKGFSAKDIEGKTYVDFLTEESKDIYIEAFRKAKETKETQYNEYRAFGDYYSIRNYESFFVPIFENDIFVNMLVIARDITDRKETEKRLAESEASARAIMESTDDVLVLLDKNGILIDCNEAHTRYLNKTREELLGKSIFGGLPPELAKSRREAVDLCISTGECVHGEDSRFGRYIEYVVHPIISENNAVEKVAVFAIDATKRKQDEQILQENEKRLRELNATKDKFFSIIAHDLKSPFNSIIGFSSLLTRHVNDKDYEGIRKYATIIQDSSQQALDLLLNLLEWSRSQTGRMVFTSEDVDVATLISQSVEVLIGAAQQKQISVHKQMPAYLVARADRAMINTILRNLISNAIKFTNPGGTIVISAERMAEELLISVADNGVGISQESIDKLFRIEETHSTLGTQKEKGTGLGLLLCKEFVEKHRGRIWVESEVGKGSTFRFSIPLRKEM
jgi:PAS domain S-box-containing protein